jgi:ribosomal-protein-serine acetyltransferase
MNYTETNVIGLHLKLCEPSYAEPLIQLINENRSYLRQWLPWLDKNTTAEDSLNFLNHCQAMHASQSQLNMLMLLNDELIGVTGFNNINHGNHHGEIGYWMSQAHTGKGFMTEAVRQVINLGFNDYGLNRQIIRAASGNIASQKIAERLGFRHEGTAREAGYLYGSYEDLEVYSLLKSEWAG